jgi:hypothetical protein
MSTYADECNILESIKRAFLLASLFLSLLRSLLSNPEATLFNEQQQSLRPTGNSKPDVGVPSIMF